MPRRHRTFGIRIEFPDGEGLRWPSRGTAVPNVALVAMRQAMAIKVEKDNGIKRYDDVEKLPPSFADRYMSELLDKALELKNQPSLKASTKPVDFWREVGQAVPWASELDAERHILPLMENLIVARIRWVQEYDKQQDPHNMGIMIQLPEIESMTPHLLDDFLVVLCEKNRALVDMLTTDGAATEPTPAAEAAAAATSKAKKRGTAEAALDEEADKDQEETAKNTATVTTKMRRLDIAEDDDEVVAKLRARVEGL